jgi:transcriptional regulator with GAF, ATPase, and Fis domain
VQVDEKEFFREATLRICGSLDVETFLSQSFNYICKFIPADTMLLTHYRAERGEHVALARASADGASLLRLAVPVPPDIRTFVMRPHKEILVVERAETHPTAKPWISRGLLQKDSSLLVLRLIVDEDIVGGVIFVSTESSAFNEEHAYLSSFLREPFAIALSNSLRYQELLALKELLAEDNRFLHDELRHMAGEEIVGAEFGLRGVMEKVRQVAPLSSPVLLWGETGTGKEVIATAIHRLSRRRDGPFITVNCGAIPESLVDSELFGHEKGAFTGALTRKRGRFERAGGGTIFLDEVGELQPEVQVRLLRVLQEKEIERIGGTEPIKVNIRVIAATHRNLASMIGNGAFREDLYFRLNVFPVEIPPLRERKGDISSLVHYFMQKKAKEMGKKNVPVLAPGALEKLMSYPWPGNVRELENMVERSLIVNQGEPIAFEDIQPPMNQRPAEAVSGLPHVEYGDMLALDAVISGHIRRVLEMAKGRVGGKGGAADLLQVNPSTLRKRMRKLGIPFGRRKKKG